MKDKKEIKDEEAFLNFSSMVFKSSRISGWNERTDEGRLVRRQEESAGSTYVQLAVRAGILLTLSPGGEVVNNWYRTRRA